MNLPAPFPPLVVGGEGLDRYPERPEALARRMSEIYDVPAGHVLPVRGVTHGLELLWRLAAREGGRVQAPATQPYGRLADIYGRAERDRPALAVVMRGFGDAEAAGESAARAAPGLLAVDEGLIEYADAPSVAPLTARHDNLIVLRSLSLAWGLAGARVGAVIAAPGALARLASVLEPYALPTPDVRLALQALDPSRVIETEARIRTVRAERERIVRALSWRVVVEPGVGPVVAVQSADMPGVVAALARLGVPHEATDHRLQLPVSSRPEVNDRLLAAFGIASDRCRPPRRGEAVRETRETRIVCTVDLDAPGETRIDTGVGFFDHMLEQTAAHGGFSLRLACRGDLHIDPHHTVEDCAIVFGQALKAALGERRGIARYGFVLPMDEAQARVSIDLSGRPYAVFEGGFETPFIGAYRTDLTAHVFRSLAEALGAAVHVSVTGADDHHKTEACFKALGRALRQAVRIEGEAVPSTKGVL